MGRRSQWSKWAMPDDSITNKIHRGHRDLDRVRRGRIKDRDKGRRVKGSRVMLMGMEVVVRGRMKVKGKVRVARKVEKAEARMTRTITTR